MWCYFVTGGVTGFAHKEKVGASRKVNEEVRGRGEKRRLIPHQKRNGVTCRVAEKPNRDFRVEGEKESKEHL